MQSLLGADLVVYNAPPVTSGNTADYNLYIRTSGAPQISWTNSSGYPVNYTSLTSLFQATGMEQHSLLSNSSNMVLSPDTYQLVHGSPAIDTGTNAVVGVGDLDLAGNKRFVDGSGKGSLSIDIGAYEFTTAP